MFTRMEIPQKTKPPHCNAEEKTLGDLYGMRGSRGVHGMVTIL